MGMLLRRRDPAHKPEPTPAPAPVKEQEQPKKRKIVNKDK